MIENINWGSPGFLYLLLIVPPAIIFYWYKNLGSNPEISISTLRPLQNSKKGLRVNLLHSLFVLRLVAIVFLIIAIARPQTKSSWQNITSEGIDIMMALDVSGSMLAEDFKPNRLEAAKKLAIEFVSGRKTDRIGLVVYSGESYTQCPLTSDLTVLKNLFMNIKFGLIDDGTAIGMGLTNAVNRLKDSEAKSKVVILLTDGVNNSGSIPPITAAEIAREMNVRVYTIGIGTKGEVPYPQQTPRGIQYQYIKADIDEITLKKIADMTGGKYYRATDNNRLKEIYQEIDLLEKSKVDVIEYRKKTESYFPLVVMAGICFLLEFILRHTLFRRIP